MPDSSLRSPSTSRGALVVALVALVALLVAGGACRPRPATRSTRLCSRPDRVHSQRVGAGGAPGDTNFVDPEVEPFVAVDPTDASNLVGVYQQDRWAGGGAHGLVASHSVKRGPNVDAAGFAAFDACSGGTGEDA